MVKLTGDERFVYDSYRRLVQMFGSVVLGIPDEAFEDPLDEYKAKKGVKLDTDLTAETGKHLTETVQRRSSSEHKGFDFPQDPLRAAEAGDRSRLQVLERQARHRLPQCRRHRP